MAAAASHTLNVLTHMGSDHKVTIQLPPSVPEGEVELFVVAVPKEARKTSTLGDLLKSDFVGMRSDRDDPPMSEEEFAAYRRLLWERRRY